MTRRRDLTKLSTKQLKTEFEAAQTARIVRADKLARIDFELVKRKRVRRTVQRRTGALKYNDCGLNVIRGGEYHMAGLPWTSSPRHRTPAASRTSNAAPDACSVRRRLWN